MKIWKTIWNFYSFSFALFRVWNNFNFQQFLLKKRPWVCSPQLSSNFRYLVPLLKGWRMVTYWDLTSHLTLRQNGTMARSRNARYIIRGLRKNVISWAKTKHRSRWDSKKILYWLERFQALRILTVQSLLRIFNVHFLQGIKKKSSNQAR